MKTTEQTANQIIKYIISDIKDRQMLGDAFNSIDAEIRHEMINLWVKRVVCILKNTE